MRRAGRLALLIAPLMGCIRAPEVVYELPVGYRGVFAVRVAADAPDLPSERRTYYVRVPPSGLIEAGDDYPLSRWHGSSAAFVDGTSIDVARGHADPPYDAETLRLFYLATTPEPRHYYFVGTEADLAELPQGNVAALPLGGVPSAPP